MSLISAFSFLVALVILGSCFRNGTDIFSPSRVYGFIWAVAIGLADLKFSRFQHEWDTYAWITLLVGVLSFFLGTLAAQVLFIGKKVQSIQQVRQRLQDTQINSRRLFFFIIFLFLGYSAAYCIEWWNMGTLPLFAKFPSESREKFGIFGIHLFITIMPSILFLIVVFFAKAKHQGYKKFTLGLIFLLTFVSSFFLLFRLPYFMFAVMTLVFAYYTTRLVRPKYVFLAAVIFLTVLTTMQSFREARYVENYFYVISEMRYSSTYAPLTGPYMYIVMNLENFAHAVGKLEQHTFGVFSFDFLLALTGLKHWLTDYFGLQERAFLVSGYNTFPYFWEYYYDFGLLGLLICPAILGFAMALIYWRLRQKPAIPIIVYYSIAIFVITISFFANVLAILNFTFNFAVLVFAQVFITRKLL